METSETIRETHRECWFGEPCAAGRPDDCPKTIAARQRDKGTPWSALELRRDAGGLRHYLDGEPVHCGEGVLLQAIEYRDDDYGSWSRALPRGTRVRYEAAMGEMEIRATLHAICEGHEFVARLEKWMRFRWADDVTDPRG